MYGEFITVGNQAKNASFYFILCDSPCINNLINFVIYIYYILYVILSYIYIYYMLYVISSRYSFEIWKVIQRRILKPYRTVVRYRPKNGPTNPASNLSFRIWHWICWFLARFSCYLVSSWDKKWHVFTHAYLFIPCRNWLRSIRSPNLEKVTNK